MLLHMLKLFDILACLKYNTGCWESLWLLCKMNRVERASNVFLFTFFVYSVKWNIKLDAALLHFTFTCLDVSHSDEILRKTLWASLCFCSFFISLSLSISFLRSLIEPSSDIYVTLFVSFYFREIKKNSQNDNADIRSIIASLQATLATTTFIWM